MPLPQLNNDQVAWIVREVAAYIQEQRQLFIARAAPLNPTQKPALRLFFPVHALDSTRVLVLGRERTLNPYFYSQLLAFGFTAESLPDFSQMAAITFVDTIVSHGPLTERTLFHELVHVVQYTKLGLRTFAAKYVTGFLKGGSYEAIPLEMNAYQLDERFASEPMTGFSVETEVQSGLMQGSFDFARQISVSPKLATHPIKLKHQVDAKGNQYEKEIVMVAMIGLHNTLRRSTVTALLPAFEHRSFQPLLGLWLQLH